MKFYHNNSLVSKKELEKTLKKLVPEIKALNKAAKAGYGDDRASINLPTDKKALSDVKRAIIEKQKLRPEYLIVAGIGGSNLGTIAVQEAVLGRYYNHLNPKTKILYVDTVDSDMMDSVIKIIEPVLKKGKNVILNGVSKSGGTTETIANFEILQNIIKKYKKDHSRYVVVTTDKDSRFWNFAKEKGFAALEIPKKVGGRYSVFSPVGLFPLGMIGINLDRLVAGAADVREKCLKKDNLAAISASLLYLNNKEARTISDMFLFSTDFESIGKWYRQLMGESIGKEYNKKKRKVNVGITPTVSIGSTDLHSMAQLYLGGPFDKYTTFVRVEKNNSDIKIPNNKEYSRLVDKIQARPLKQLMEAILIGTQIAFRKNKRAYCEIVLRDKTEFSIGQLLQFKMIEIMFLGSLLDVNPFDQPNVESYKVETKRLLSR